MKLTIPMNLIKAAIPCVAVKDVRYYITGALLEVGASEGTDQACTLRVVSTDGGMLSVFDSTGTYTEVPQTAAWSIIIPLAALMTASKTKATTLTLASLPDGRYSLGDVIFTAIDGKFPDYKRVVPESFDGVAAQFDPDLMARAKKALQAFGPKGKLLRVEYGGGLGTCLMHGELPGAFVVVMCLKDNDRLMAPKWGSPLY